jgi:predicted GIY-YIG superfamily endonuclease
MFLYSLRLEKGRWYIGTTNNPVERLSDHRTHRGSVWTRLYSVVGGYNSLSKIDKGHHFQEDTMVKTLMLQYGVDMVRGGSYSNRKLTAAQKHVLTCELRHARGVCIRCGEGGHYARECVKGVSRCRKYPLKYVHKALVSRRKYLRHQKTCRRTVESSALRDPYARRRSRRIKRTTVVHQ